MSNRIGRFSAWLRRSVSPCLPIVQVRTVVLQDYEEGRIAGLRQAKGIVEARRLWWRVDELEIAEAIQACIDEKDAP